jgi:hypothetical protein
MRLTRVVTGAALVLAAGLAVPATASASTTPAANDSGIPWQPYRTSPWTDVPGTVCSFGVSTSIVEDQEQERVLATYPDGHPKLQEFRGPLAIRYTNASTGASVVRDLSGYAWFHYGTDGSIVAFIASHIGVTVHVGNAGWPAGEWVISGQSVVTVSSAGAINVKLLHATTEDLCQTLS